MSDVILIGVVSGLLGVAAAAVPAYLTARNAPSRKVSNATLILDASGKVVMTLREELNRLDAELDETREEALRLRRELEARPTKAEMGVIIDNLRARVDQLTAIIEKDPDLTVPPPPKELI